jgi:4-amino-4-deoxy-L-arabinose transferase-like glycosyltransferase
LLTGDGDLIANLPGGGQFYGPLFYMLNYGVSSVAENVLGMHRAAANHLLTLATASSGVLCTGLLAARMFGRAVAVGALVLLCLLPPFLAHAQYNPKDIPLLTLATATLLFAVRAYRDGRVRDGLLSGFFLGLAIAMKPSALVLIPIVGGGIVADLLARRPAHVASRAGLTKLVAAGSVAAAVGLIAGWPTLLRRPDLLLGSIRYFASGQFWDGQVLYFGAPTPATELPWHYAPVMLALAMPAAMLLLAVAGAILVGRRVIARDRVFEGALLLLWVAVPLALFMKPGLARYDGMRQLFFVVPAVAILGGVGWAALWPLSDRSSWTHRLNVALSVAFVAWLVVENARVFPYGGSYVNAPARLVLGPHLERRFEVEYWGVAYREGMRWLHREAEPGATVCVPVASQLLPWHQVLYWQRETSRSDLTYECRPDARYVMLITRFAEWPNEYRRLLGTAPVFTVSRLGADLLYIYDVRQ